MPAKKTNEIAVISRREILPEDIKTAAWNSLAIESQKAYSSDYKLFFDFIKKDPKNISPDDILKFIEYLEENNYKNNSINRKVASLSKMFKIMVLAGEIRINPVDALKQFKKISRKVSKTINVSLTMAEIRQVVKIVKSSTNQERRMSLIIRTLGKTGLRISEFINIKYKDIENYNETDFLVRIVGKGSKERFIFIEKDFIKEIQSMYPKKEDMAYLFYNTRGHRYDRKVLWKQIRGFFWEKIEKDVHPHLLRHAFATHKISVEKQDIKAVSLYLGHSDVSITLSAYCDTALDVKNSKIKI